MSNLGYNNRIIKIDLTTRTITTESIPQQDLLNFIGGSGLATKILAENLKQETSPFSPDNILIFATGPFQGSKLPGSAKWVVVGKSPITNTFSVSAAGASWGIKLKKAGYDALIITGKASNKVFICIEDGKVEIKSANHLWGKDAVETPDLIQNELKDKKYSVACIGRAGEKQVGIACIVVDSHSFVGRTGLGAVMGSKNLKAIAVKGNKEIQVYDSNALITIRSKLSRKLKNKNLSKHGTARGVIPAEAKGDLPVKYWSGDIWPDGAEKIGAPYFTEFLNAKPWYCLYCPIGCHRKIEFKNEDTLIRGAGPEYESLGMLGSCCMIDNLITIAKANDMCNRYGIDTVSAGAFVGFCMQCFEKGLISKTFAGGIKPTWGNDDFLIEMIRLIGENEGCGKLFSKGIKSAAEKIGQEANKIAVHVKGLDFPAHDPRATTSLAINYATGTRGACHLRGFPHCGEGGMLIPEANFTEPIDRFTMDGKANLAILFQNLASVSDSLVLCIFMQTTGESLSEVTDSFNQITGRNLKPLDLLEAGERIWNLQRLINIRDGITFKDDVLPDIMFIPANKGSRRGKVPLPFNSSLNEYYRNRGWDEDGKPTENTLDRLKLNNFVHLV